MSRRFWLLLGAAFLFRVALAATPGFAGDRLVFEGWARVLATQGPLAIYGSHVDPVVDYSPGYLYVLWGAGLVHAALGGGRIAWRVLLEIIPIGGDLVLIALLYRIARKTASERAALIYAAVLAFAPPLWLDSAIWGQSDAVPIALTIVAITTALDARFSATWPALALALFVKPLVIVVGPLIALLNLRSRTNLRSGALGIGIAAAGAYLLTLPFTADRSPIALFRFLVERYVRGAGKAPFVTEGGFSIYPLVTQFYTPDSTRFGPLTFHTWGVVLVSLTVCTAAFFLAQSIRGNPDKATQLARVFGAACISLLGLFLFATRMHERYLLPAIVIGSPLALDDRPTAYALAWLAVSFTIDCIYSLSNFTGGAHHPITVTIGRALCALNLAAFFVLCQRQHIRLTAEVPRV